MSEAITVLYFAALREQLDCDRETMVASDTLNTVAALRDHLSQRAGSWQAVFSGGTTILASVNQEMATPETAIAAGDEVAFFPPVTGG